MEESYRIDSVFEHRLSVSFPRFSQFLSSFYPPIPSTTTLLLTRYQSCISPLSTGVSALKYLVNLDEARKSRTRRVSEKGTAKKGNCARCHSFFFRSFSPSFSFSFFPPFFSSTILPFSPSIHACCRATLPIQHRARTTTSIAVRICMQVTRDLLPANLEPSDNLRVYASIWL